MKHYKEKYEAPTSAEKGERRHGALLEIMQTGYVVFNEVGKVLDANSEYVRLSGHHTLSDIIGRSDLEWTAPRDLRRRMDAFQTCLDQEYIKDFEIHYVDSTGRLILVEMNAMISYTPAGIRILSLCQDISKYERIEEEVLNISEQKCRTLINNANDAILLFDSRGQVIEVNKKAEGMFGYTHQEFLKKHLLQLHPESERHQECQALRGYQLERVCNLFTKGVCVRSNDMLMLTEDGNTIPVDMSCSLIEYGGQKSLLKIIRDVSHRKREEIVLQQEHTLLTQRVKERTAELRVANEALEKANRLKNEFLSSVSHELRTPLNAILNISEGLLEQTRNILNDKQFKYLQVIRESGEHLLSVISDILDLSKIEAGKVSLQIDKVNIEFICQTSLNTIRQTAIKKQLEVVYSSELTTPYLSVDGRRLKQILTHLLDNAVKFTPSGGKVGLSIYYSYNNWVNFKVWDTGIGIAEEDISQIFKPFIQMDGGLSRQYGGVGLGLTLVYRLVELHGGHITVESTLDEGSQFIVSFRNTH
jgi:PAS domain S-box-containing protein